jgi:putative endopeptidase
VAHFSQGGLGLPERDYYLSTDAEKKTLRATYEQHVTKMLAYFLDAGRARPEAGEGDPDLRDRARQGLAPDRSDARRAEAPPSARCRRARQAHAEAPLDALLRAFGQADLAAINVMTPEFFPALQKEIGKASLPTLKAYLRYQMLSATAGLLPDAVYQQHFDFQGRTLAGQKEPQPRWKRCIQATEQAMGEAIGQLYVRERFAGNSKELALDMIHGIADAFAASLPALSWMDEPTRAGGAGEEGDPGLEDRLSGRVARLLEAHHHARQLLRQRRRGAQLRGVAAPRPGRQAGRPQGVGDERPDGERELQPAAERLHLPAGILQPPFFHKDFPVAMNLGAMGFVIGHELTHGFDDQGSKFDSTGSMTDWWTPASVKGFEERTACIDRSTAPTRSSPESRSTAS